MELPSRRNVLICAGTGAAIACGFGAAARWMRPVQSEKGLGAPPKDWEVFAGASYSTEPTNLMGLKPQARLIRFPDFDGAFAIWGAVGRDANGRILFAPACHFVDSESGRLFEYDSASDRVAPRGDVLSELRRLGLYRPGEQQPKIHTKFSRGEDGCLYFASSDDAANGESAIKPPRWGSHLWRMRGSTWEHLHAFHEGIIALAGNGRLMYCLAHPDHVLIQYDCSTGNLRKVTVGSVEGHISRHILCDYRGHAYVPRLKMVAANHAEHTLVEFDEDLREVVQHSLPHYQFGSAADCHGIIAYQPLADGSIAFTTHAGRLFKLEPGRDRSRLVDLGWFHPSGRSYASGLFAFSGERYLVGAANFENRWVWINYDLDRKSAREMPLEFPTPKGWSSGDPFLYGCTTRDDSGDFYMAGAFRNESGARVPIGLRIRLSDSV